MSDSPATFRLAALCGSLRAASYNRALLAAARELAPAGTTFVEGDLRSLPQFDADLEAGEGAAPPEPVAALRAVVRDADAILIATPEYNYGPPGLLKNGVDWLSRPPAKNVLSGKSAALMGAGPGGSGTIRAQQQLRQNLHGASVLVMPKPELHLPNCAPLFDASMRLTDGKTRDRLAALLVSLRAWALRMKAPVS